MHEHTGAHRYTSTHVGNFEPTICFYPGKKRRRFWADFGNTMVSYSPYSTLNRIELNCHSILNHLCRFGWGAGRGDILKREYIFGRGRKTCRKVAVWSEVAKQLHLPMHEYTEI